MNRSPYSHEISPTPHEVSCTLDSHCIAGESPVWSARDNCLYSVDHQGHKIIRFDLANKVHKIFNLPDVVTSLAVRASGGLVVTMRRAFAFFDTETGRLDMMSEVEPSMPDNRFNDGKCDRQGRFWGGTMGASAWGDPVGNLYRLNPDGQYHRQVSGVRCSNGLDWSPDNRTFYFAESFAHVIHAYDFDDADGTLSNRRDFARIDPSSGAFPDGLTVDVEGYVWNAQPVFGRIVRYDPNGTMVKVVETPVSWPTSCIFGGADMETMFITSARESLSLGEINEEPQAGGIFSFRPGVKGLAATEFAG
jgi:sugar lactone lactonase YvrE